MLPICSLLLPSAGRFINRLGSQYRSLGGTEWNPGRKQQMVPGFHRGYATAIEFGHRVEQGELVRRAHYGLWT